MRFLICLWLIFIQIWVTLYLPFNNQIELTQPTTSILLSSELHNFKEEPQQSAHTHHDNEIHQHQPVEEAIITTTPEQQHSSHQTHFECFYCQIVQQGVVSLEASIHSVSTSILQSIAYHYSVYYNSFTRQLIAFLRPFSRAPPMYLI